MSKKTAMGLLPLFLSLVCLTGGLEENVEAVNEFEKLSNTEAQIVALLSGFDLVEVSSSVLKAESWLRSQVLAHYPITRFTNIVVGHNVLCNKEEAQRFELVLPSLKNMFWCLKRWGLENEIKLSASFSSSCLSTKSDSFKQDLVESLVKPVLTFLNATNSTYSIDLDSKDSSLVSFHYESLKKVGFLSMEMIHVTRKLVSVVDSKFVKPYPARPTPLQEISPIHSSIGYSSPAIVPKIPSTSPPIPSQAPIFIEPTSPPFSNLDPPHDPPPFINSHPPQVSPSIEPVSPPALAPCSPPSPTAPKESSGLWCVGKPSVPAETLQVGLDYACGAGGADCDEIKPYGSCFYPNTVVAHASYAFNSYWQKHKKRGGSCSFGGTAMLINADPSFMHCRFVLG